MFRIVIRALAMHEERRAGLLSLPTEVHCEFMGMVERSDLQRITWVSHKLRQVAVPILWCHIGSNARWVERMLEDMIREIPDRAEAARVRLLYLCWW